MAVLTLPGLMDLAQGRVRVDNLLDLDIDDLLGREPLLGLQLLEKQVNLSQRLFVRLTRL